jgi:UDPglucose 6-dehydrogenase
MPRRHLASHIQSHKRKIAVLGMGHVGLPTALGLVEMGWRVIGADNNDATIELLKQQQCTFYEPGLQELLRKHMPSERLALTSDIESAIRECSILFICVGTPHLPSGEADLTAIEALARAIARNLNGYKLIVQKSTAPPLTGQWLKKTITRHLAISNGHGNGHGNGHAGVLRHITPSFDVASSPEFLQEGKALENFFRPDRVVCGVTSDRARRILGEIYDPLQCPILFTDLNTAEVIKYAANTFLATKISFANMISDICDAVGADVEEVHRGIGLDPRIGPSFLKAGLGFGGYCLPKDLRAFVHLAREHHVDASLLSEVERINQRRTERFMKKLREALWLLQHKTIAVLGLAFKPGTDDIREAPSLRVIHALLQEGARLRLYDPKAMENMRQVFPPQDGRATYCQDPYEAASGAHALVILTEWEEFRALDLSRIRTLMEVPVVLDGRNLLDPESVRRAGFEYVCMGRRAATVRIRRAVTSLPYSVGNLLVPALADAA